MNLTSKLAKSQLKINRFRTMWTLIGIVLSVAMLTAVYGFALGGRDLIVNMSIETLAIGAAEYTDDGYQVAGEFVESYLYQSARFTRIFVSIAAILSVVIVGISVVIVSNAFRISATERLRQFGILKSVGATRRQIRQTVIYESVYLALIGIPIGIGLGLLVQMIGIQIVNHFLVLTPFAAGTTETLHFTLSWEILIAAVLISFVMAILAAWLPARKAARVTAIDAIRGAGEVKVKAKHLRRGRIVGKVFGYEGTLAAKSLRRNRRNIRATVLALAISIVLFISAAGLGHTVNRTAHIVFGATTNHIIVGGFAADWRERDTFLESETANEITQRLLDFGEVDLIAVGSDNGTFRADVPRTMMTPAMLDFLYEFWFAEQGADYHTVGVTLVTADPETYAELARQADVPDGSNILLNHFTMQFTQFDEDGATGTRWLDFVPYRFSPLTIELTDREDYSHPLELHGVLNLGSLPNEVWDAAGGGSGISILVPDLAVQTYSWFATPTYDTDGFTTYFDAVLHEKIDAPVLAPGESGVRLSVWNLLQEADMIVSTGRLVMVFVYGFVSLLIIIGLTNIISTVSTNIYARFREFAMLKSVGMDRRGLRRILNLESVLCSAKAVVIGLPIGILASWLIHGTMADTVMFAFEVPWIAVAQCVIGVFVITWVVTMVSARKLRRQNVVEALRVTG